MKDKEIGNSMIHIKHINNLITANNDNRLAIFVGAGISKGCESSAVKIPTWEELINDLKSELGLSNGENDYLKIAQLYYLEFEEFTYYEKLKSYFPNNIEPSLIHKLIFDINPQCIITTNWDTILEKTIENDAFIFDVISSDVDLVKSTLQKKLIKMHGDFKSHNIVFKEDDYLNYKYNFPIIENYIKSILSTHTVLFMGYSYNDVNLKQILKWLQNHSKVSPPKYLVTFKPNETQEKYLKNHNINVLTLSKEDEKYKYLDIYSRKLATFLSFLANPKKATLYQNSDDEVVEYFHGKLEILDTLEGILLDQIRNALSVCDFIYNKDSIFLKLYIKNKTTDLDQEGYLINDKFIKILKKFNDNTYDHKGLYFIFKILIKANIDGIVISDDTISKIDVIEFRTFGITKPNDRIVEKLLNFDFSYEETSHKLKKLSDQAYNNYQIRSYEVAYNISEEVISLCLKHRNYSQLFISMFNRNLLLRYLKFYSRNREKYQSTKEYDLSEKFRNLPKDLQTALNPIYLLLNFDYLYKHAFNTSKELERSENERRIIENGGRVFGVFTESVSRHRDVVLFMLRNKIMIEEYIEYKTINKNFLKISVINQLPNNETTFNKIEIYSCIKYLENNELKLLLHDFYLSDRRISLSSEILNWLTNTVINNLGEIYINAKVLLENHVNNLSNAIFILSLIELNQEVLNKVISVFIKILSEAKNTLIIYKSIDQFLGIQYKLFKTKIENDVLINMIEIIIIRFVNSTYNKYDFHVMSNQTIDNIYGYLKESATIFENYDLVARLLFAIKDLNHRDKLKISQSLLLNLYDISDEKIRNLIRECILSMATQLNFRDGEDIVFELLLFIRGIKVEINKNIIENIKCYLDQFDGVNRFTSIIYSLNAQFKYLAEKMSEKHFNDLLDRTSEMIKNHERSKNFLGF